MAIEKNFNPQQAEEKWYNTWLQKGYFHSEPDEREPYTIVIPPPNVTGVLHMGHSLNNTLQDVLIRRARMQGKNACWVPGTDHASIATEAKVVNMLKEKGIDKNSISREEFLQHAWEWKEKYGGIILQQLKKLGASCDWNRVNFTMDPHYYQSVIKVFVDLHKKGLVYRGTKLINWDPKAKTALSDEEVNHRDVQSKLYYLRYEVEGFSDGIVIATVRPETILGDTAIFVHPEDERYTNLIGKHAKIPLLGRLIPIIADEYVDKEYGSGALKVTPAHDRNDYELGKKHNLETINILNEDGSLSAAAKMFVGLDRFEARKAILVDLEEQGYLVRTQDITSPVGFSERTDAVVEPFLSPQWFCDMQELTKPALKAVLEDEVQLVPAKFKNTYRHWMENIRDWCISRQLWWGQRIPAWYLPDGSYVVAENEQDALQQAKEKTSNQNLQLSDLKQDEDVLDTWFSSWLWPIAVFNGILEPDNKEINYYYPTNTLVTGHDIIFFWVARMIVAGYEYRNEKPFKYVYFTGMVRDKQGRKMSKQLGNSPDLLNLIDTYGADGVRFGVMVSSPAGGDLLFDEKLCEQGRNFCNKQWNALRLVKGWEENNNIGNNPNFNRENAVKWMENRLNQAIAESEKHMQNFSISEALMTLYKLAWDDFCSWYLEMVKPTREELMDPETHRKTLELFEQILQALHPFMPFITEEIWQNLKERSENEHCTMATYPKTSAIDHKFLDDSQAVQELVTALRGYRSQAGMAFKIPLDISIKTTNENIYKSWQNIIARLVNVETMEFTQTAPANAKTFVVGGDECYVQQEEGAVDVEAEREKLAKELEYTQGFLRSVEGKLNNERFVQNAKPEVVEKEKEKREDALAKIKALEETLARLN